ncbi:F-box protein CPR1-like [Lathyrus oleraceus]|uniref:F-box protein CPR1-like n=1 Tax=Pisum sativum TaxID=3888 RepID=UPI0021D344C7|nr:F-box protein CPR1-like [Pisum sativum]
MDYQQKLSLPFNKWSDSKVSRKYIDDDVAFHVLSKLPVKSLKRFGCVRKSWSILFENSHFINMFRNHFISHSNSEDHRTYLLIFKRDCANRYHPELHLLDSRIKLILPPPFQEDVFCIGTKNVKGGSNKVKYVLWNPAIEEFVVIPPSPDELVPKHPRLGVFHDFHGFGYDQVRDDFKVIQYVTFDSCNDYDPDSPPPQGIMYFSFFEIYSLRNNSWKILHMDDMAQWCVGNPFNGEELYMNGASYWLVKEKIIVVIPDFTRKAFFRLEDQVTSFFFSFYFHPEVYCYGY